MIIVPVDPTKAFIVTSHDDKPMVDVTGNTLVFYREVDAQRFIDTQTSHDQWIRRGIVDI